ncbi:MAG: leucine-rich repeat domain-containing protein [Prevotella sp.]|jgi:hypothetical protein|nr:leucine-rich repeat domain-containing protein [Prevotella sp.]
MGTTAQKLQAVLNSKEGIRQAINDKGVPVDTSVKLSGYAEKIRQISAGGGGGGATPWTPQPDWWDIQQIFNDDPDPDKRMIILLSDSNNSVNIKNAELGGNKYATSDGAVYEGTGDFIHTWDASQDKPCSLGYSTRYITVYNTAGRNIVGNVATIDALFVFAGDANLTGMKAGGTSYGSANQILEAFKTTPGLTTSNSVLTSYAFMYCSSLALVAIPDSVTTMNSGAFDRCKSLRTVTLSANAKQISSSTFAECTSLKSFAIPKAVTNIVGSFSGLSGLLTVIVEPGWVSPALDISYSKYLTVASLVDLFNNLGPASVTVTIKIGSTNLAKLTDAQIAIATGKGYTLA